jgi:hypothetical protein
MKRALAIVFAWAVFLAAPAMAEVPGLLSYQGVLTNAAGVVVPDGSYSIVFKIYDVPDGGSAIWQETDDVQVTKGIFNAILGIDASFSALKFDTTYYISLTVAGGSELQRQELTASPYSLNARGVYGSANVFPSSGKVGIGTKAPDYQLHVINPTGQVGIQLDGGDPSWSSLYVNAVNANAKPAYGYLRQGTLLASTFVDNAGIWTVELNGSTDAIRASQAGNVSIGATYPSTERFRVDGGIELGNALGTNAGTLRWTGSDFEGYDGSTWKSLTATGGGLPGGTTGQTLRYNGADWVGTSNLFNNGTSIGIGTTAPTSQLQVEGSTGTQEIFVNQTNPTGIAAMRLKAGGAAYDHFAMQKFASVAASIDGISLSDMALLDAGIDGGPLMLRVGSNNPMYFLSNNTERMRLTGEGNLGINAKDPSATLHVGGGVKIGTPTNAGSFDLYGAGNPNPLISMDAEALGGGIRVFDKQVSDICGIVPGNQNGAGDFFVSRTSGNLGFEVIGNYAGTGDPLVNITGALRSASFDMSATGDLSVNLPVGAISAPEIMDEPGIASATQASASALTGSYAAYASQTIFAPADGYVLVTATMDASPVHTNGTITTLIIGVSDGPSSLPTTQNFWLQLPAVMPTGTYHYPVTVSGLFQVTAGSHPFYLVARASTGAGNLFERQLSLLYVPTAYGSFIAPLTEAGSDGSKKEGAAGGPITPSEIAAQRAASESANAARMQKELDEMKARLAQLEVEQKNR